MGISVVGHTHPESRDMILNQPHTVSRLHPAAIFNSTNGIYFALAMLVILGKSLSISSYFVSSYLYQDDSIFVGAAYLGSPMPSPQTQSLYYGLIEIMTDIGGMLGLKLILILMPVVTCLFMFKILMSFTSDSFVAAAVSLFVTLFPVSPEQSYFFTGAHPTAGIMLFVIIAFLYLEMLKHQDIWPPVRRSLYFLICGMGFYAISKTSPTFTLVPLLLIPMSAQAWWRDRNQLSAFHGVCLIVPTGLFLLLFASAEEYHYSSLVGWAEISLSRTLTNLSQSMEYIFQTPFVRHPKIQVLAVLSFLVFAAAFVMLLAHTLRRKNGSARQYAHIFWPFILFLLLGGALVFGPGSVTTNYLDRYAIAPFQIGGLLLGILIVIILDQSHAETPKLEMAASVALFSLVAVTLIHASLANRDRLTPLLSTHNKIIDTLGQRAWKSDDQILILLPKGEVESTGGYNHWSTWYLRVATKTPGLIGLVGNQGYANDLQTNGLFIDVYRDHDPIFWSVKDGMSKRAHMLGLTPDRATYAFAGIEGKLTMLPLRLQWNGAGKTLQPGQRFQDVASVRGAGLTCDATSSEQAFLVNISKPGLNSAEKATGHFVRPPFVATGQAAKFLDVPEDATGNTSIHLELKGSPGGPVQPYSKTYPQMPLVAPGFGVYLQTGNYYFQERDGEKQLFTAPVREGKPTIVDIIDCGPGQSKNALYLDGTFRGMFSSDVMYGRWRIGAGFEDRYWEGEISWELSHREPQ